ncbi:MAG TPA: ABC transporter substrate-binding protein, partial [Acidimicrobiaceae bacterium]|nr:ABC transporter substrate-binding protein [Acidimicrobiaceae bacterium]
MNRIALLLVSITALALLASACGGSGGETAEAPPTTEAPATSDAEDDGESTETSAA